MVISESNNFSKKYNVALGKEKYVFDKKRIKSVLK